MKALLTRWQWHTLFELGVFFKALNGAWETIAAVSYLFFGRLIARGFFFIFGHELLEDPHDKILGFFMLAFQHFSSSSRTFAAVYLLTHGILNLFLAVQLYRNRYWAYLFAVGVTAIFMIYQIYRIFLYHSLILGVITVWDMFFIIFVLHEYRELTRQAPQ